MMTATTRREQILHEATHLFAANGYQGTSIRSIADACQITEAAIYRYFDGKEQLYEEVIRWKAKDHDTVRLVESLGHDGTIDDVLRGVAEHILNYLETDPELLGLMFSNSIETGPAAAVLFKEVRLPYINYIASEIERRKQTGEVRNVREFITARCFVGMVMDCAMSVGAWNKVTKFDFNASDVIANNVPIFARGLKA